jgi:uncharacterized repeat protein (TIGR01451 family)
MKRLFVAVVAGASLWFALSGAIAYQRPDRPHLPNFDKRHDQRPEQPELPARNAAAAAVLEQRIPGLRVTVDRVLQSPAFVSAPEGFLTGPGGQGKGIQVAAVPNNQPHGPLRAFLNEHSALLGFGPEALDAATLKRDYVTAHNGIHTAVWEQHLNGIPVFDSVFMAHITRNGELVNITSRFMADLAAAARGHAPRPLIAADQAVMAAAANINEPLLPGALAAQNQPEGVQQKQRFKAGPQFDDDTTAELVWVPLDPQTMVLGWDVSLTSIARGEMFRIIVHAETGEVLVRRCLTRYISDATYNVYTSDSPSPFSPGHPTPLTAQPALISRTLVTLSALNTNASLNGWINDGDNETRGNNVDAHLDRDRNNQPDLPRPQGNPARVFDFPLDLTQSPLTYGDAAVVQLFYWCNWMHDQLWDLGFTEAAGNFQNSNFGRGGFGNDAVQADAQDGSGFNNANFATPRDGFPPRMQMYRTDGPNPERDGDFDAEVVLHEYTHGLSERLVGGGVGITELQPSGMGEGWSDWYAMTLLSEAGDDPAGNYASGAYFGYQLFGLTQNYYFGDRHYPYSTNLLRNPLTFKDIDPNQASPHVGVPLSPLYQPFDPTSADEVHGQGEFWCVTLWEARANMIAKHGFTNGNRMILQLVTDGMKLSPVDPTFLQARDAIIQADQINNGGSNFFELWSAFAKRGMGSSATCPASGTTAGIVEAFDLPGLGFKRAIVADSLTGNANGAIDFNECTELLVALFNNDRNPAVNVRATLTTTTPGVTVSQGDSLYPNIAAFSTATNLTPFRIYVSPAFVCGASIDFQLDVVSANDSRTLRFRVATGLIGAPQRFDNFTPLNIPDARPAGVESAVSVSGFSSLLAKITVSLYITHTFDFDLSIQLIAPDGTRAVLSSLHGEDGDNYGASCGLDSQRTTFDDKATVAIASGRAPFVGVFRPDQALATFVGKPASAVNGVWRLRIADNFFQDTGTLQCWSLNLSPAVCIDGGGDCTTDIAVSGTASAPALVGSNLVYTLVVTNRSFNNARNVTLTDTLPNSVQFVSATSSRGSCSQNSGIVTCSLGTLARRDSATVTVTVRPTVEGLLTNNVSVATSVVDSVPENDAASIVSLVRLPYPIIVQDVVTMASETGIPANGALDVGETVTLNFGLRNIGAVSTTDLQVKLLNGNGVADASGQQSYGVLVPDGPAAYRPFTFRVATTNGGLVLAALQLQDGTNNLGTVTFAFGVSSSWTFTSSSVVTIPDSGPAGSYPSRLFVSGVSGLVSRVSVTLNGLTHTYPSDLDIVLAGPNGGIAMLMSDAGGGTAVNNLSFTLDDAAASLLSTNQLVPGTFKPTDYEPGENLPAPAPQRPYTASFDSFVGVNPNGFWSLYIADDAVGDQGRLNGGWSVTLQTSDPVNPETDLAVSVIDVPDPVMVGSNLTYTVVVTNIGPETAGEIVVTNVLPASAIFVSAIPSQGSCSQIADRVICNLGTIPNDATAAITITVQPTAAGVLTLGSTVFANALDFHQANNTATAITTVAGLADLQLAISDSPDPVFIRNTVTYTLAVSNAGPNTALGVGISNTLPVGVAFISAVASQGTGCSLAGSIVNCSLGSIPSGGQATVTIQVTTPANVGSLTNRATVRAASPADPNSGNNSALARTANVNPSFIIVAAGALLRTEASPPTGGIEAGETVTVDLFLRNNGSASTTNLIATLVPGGGVTAPGPAQNYGALFPSGGTASRPFSFTASASASGTLTATLQLAEGSLNLGTVTFAFPLGSTTRFGSPASISIPDNGKASVYPAPLPVSGMAGQITKLTVTLSNLSHAYPDDVDILLVGPAGQKALILSDVGGANRVTGVTLTLDDSAANALPDASALTSGTFKPTNFDTTSDAFEPPAPPAPYATNLALFNGTDPNGTWGLYVRDDTFGDLGDIDGWSLTITTVGRLSGALVRLSSTTILPNGRISFVINGEAGATYMIEASSDLSNWQSVGSRTLSGTTATFDEPRSASHRFYRVFRQL